MPRPKNIIPTVEKTVSLPETLVTAVELELISEVEGKVPFGAWKKFLSKLVEDYLAGYRNREALAARMRIEANNPDVEGAHMGMDDLLCDELRRLGYGEAVRIFQEKEKWYA